MNAHTPQFGVPAAPLIAAEGAPHLRLPRAVWHELRAHGEETYPHECCGALLGKPAQESWRIEAVVRATNAHIDVARYEIAPAELVRIVHEARGRGLEIAGFYHSHPDHPAQWSATDLEEAHWLGLSYVITEVVAGNAETTHAWLLAGTSEEDKHFEAQEIRIEEC